MRMSIFSGHLTERGRIETRDFTRHQDIGRLNERQPDRVNLANIERMVSTFGRHWET